MHPREVFEQFLQKRQELDWTCSRPSDKELDPTEKFKGIFGPEKTVSEVRSNL